MKRIANQTITDERVDCDGIQFHNVLFDGCVLRLSRRNGARFTGSTQAFFCKMLGDGWTDETLMLNAAHLAQHVTPLHEVEVMLTKSKSC